jgi:hypothetical protein
MAPSGSLYSTKDLDPRLLSKLEQAPEESQLRPSVVEQDSSSDSSIAPPLPPAKDTPLGSAKQPFTEAAAAANVHLSGPEAPVLTHQSQSGEDENQRLEDEIVRRLSPQPKEGNPLDASHLIPQSGATARESTYLPAEYGDYWASNTDDTSKALSEHPPQLHPANELPKSSRVDEVDDVEQEPVAPLSVAKGESSTMVGQTVDRPAIKQRFSWEQSSENVSSVDVGKESEVLPPLPLNASSPRGPNLPSHEAPIQHVQPDSNSYPSHDEKIALESTALPTGGHQDTSGQQRSHTAVIVGGSAALATGAIVAPLVTDGPNTQPQRRASLAEEKATRVSSYPVNVTPPESEHPARSSEPYFTSGPDRSGYPAAVGSDSPAASPVLSPPPATSSRLLAFKEILNMKTSHERRQTFDETRQRFAAMDSGLSNWMEVLRAQHPEHSNASGLWAAGPISGSAGRPTKGTGAASGLQQPYYQQYLNASSPTNPSTPTSAPGPSGSAAYQQQGFPASSSASNKITTQQVQAKGKEFLHTAGVFGGKAGKAGKGLLAKGKSKFRGSGGDKVD